MNRAERFAAWLYDRRWVLAAACALVSALALWQAAKLGVDNSLRIWFLDDDPHLVAYRSYQERFGNDEVVLVAFENSAGMGEGRGLQLLRRAESTLAGVDGVAGAMSIAALPEE